MSILNVNQIQPVGSGQTVTISAANIDTGSSTVTAGTFSGNLSSSGISTFSDTVNVGAGKSIRLYGATSGYSEIIAAAGSASTTFTLPANGGSASQYLQTDGSGVLSWSEPAGTGATWVTGTLTDLSGATVTITGIPSNAVQVLVTIQDSSIAGTSNQFLRLGAGGTPATSNYAGSSAAIYSAAVASNPTTSFNITTLTSSSHSFSGHILITKIDTGDYVVTAQMHSSFNNGNTIFGGRLQLGGTLDRVQWGSGSTFDAGQIRVDYLTQD